MSKIVLEHYSFSVYAYYESAAKKVKMLWCKMFAWQMVIQNVDREKIAANLGCWMSIFIGQFVHTAWAEGINGGFRYYSQLQPSLYQST